MIEKDRAPRHSLLVSRAYGALAVAGTASVASGILAIALGHYRGGFLALGLGIICSRLVPRHSADSRKARTSALRRRAFIAIAVTMLFAVTKALSYSAIHFWSKWDDRPVLRTPVLFELHRRALEQLLEIREEAVGQFDPRLGWVTKLNTNSPGDLINSQGLRSDREYSRKPLNGTIRVTAFGDSFVYGSEVAGEDSWPSLIEQEFPEIEVLNYGVPGYGNDQAYLRFEAEAADFDPDIVIMGVVTPTLHRIITAFSGFRHPRPNAAMKPRSGEAHGSRPPQ